MAVLKEDGINQSFSCSILLFCIQILNDYKFMPIKMSLFPSLVFSFQATSWNLLTLYSLQMLNGDFWGTVFSWGFETDHIWVKMVFREQKKRTGWANAVSYEHNGWKFKAIQKWLGETPELFQALQSKRSAPFVQSMMIRTEIQPLSSKVLVDASKIQLAFQAASTGENGPQRRTTEWQTNSQCLFGFCIPPNLNVVSSSSI